MMNLILPFFSNSCGRLPLCLNIVGNLIRTFGEGWEDEVPGILRTDMGSLMQDESSSSKKGASVSMHTRVIQVRPALSVKIA